jgi:hypothetical protein
LKEALRRVEPPAGFAERTLARIPPQSQGWMPRVVALFRMPALRWATVGAVIVCLLIAGWVQQEHARRVRAEGEIAKAQLIEALRITSVKLNTARRKVQDVGRRTSELQAPVDESGYGIKS